MIAKKTRKHIESATKDMLRSKCRRLLDSDDGSDGVWNALMADVQVHNSDVYLITYELHVKYFAYIIANVSIMFHKQNPTSHDNQNIYVLVLLLTIK